MLGFTTMPAGREMNPGHWVIIAQMFNALSCLEKYQMQLSMSLHNEILEHISEYRFWKCKLAAHCFGLTVGVQTGGDTGTVPSAQHFECT